MLGETALMWAARRKSCGGGRGAGRAAARTSTRGRGVTTFPKFKFGDGIVARTDHPAARRLDALMYAARQGALDAARTLADAGADLNLTDPDGTNALVLAIINAHYDVAAMLLEKGADPNIADAHRDGRAVRGGGHAHAARDGRPAESEAAATRWTARTSSRRSSRTAPTSTAR